MKYITSMIAVTLLGLILVTTAVLVFAARNSGSRLRKKFDHIGPVAGKSYKELTNHVGPPHQISRTGDKEEHVWIAKDFQKKLTFNGECYEES